MQYCNATELFTLTQVQELKPFHKQAKKSLKELLYEGLSTEERIRYWTTMGDIETKIRNKRSVYRSLQRKSKFAAAISLDVIRTYPTLKFFQYGEEYYYKLSRVLNAISLRFPKIGYCQGMSFFAATILLILTNEEVFVWCT